MNTLDTVEDTLHSTRSLDSTESDDFVNKIEIPLIKKRYFIEDM